MDIDVYVHLPMHIDVYEGQLMKLLKLWATKKRECNLSSSQVCNWILNSFSSYVYVLAV